MEVVIRMKVMDEAKGGGERKMGEDEKREEYTPLLEKKSFKGSVFYRMYAATILLSASTVVIYRFTHHMPMELSGGWRWMMMTMMVGAEMWFGFYWILSQTLRWNRVRRTTFKRRLSLRYEEELPAVDVFVCTADPTIEPPLMVINTVLSAMAYDYPPEKLAVYLSDDGGSELTFYAMWEASMFAKHWMTYCRNFSIEPRSPAAYFKSTSIPVESSHAMAFASIKNLYEDMARRIEDSTRLGRVSEEARCKHKGFSEWGSNTSKHNHHTILQILVDGVNTDAKDVEGKPMPKLVYLAREKRPQHFHNFKAGAMNALLRVSSKISNGAIILNVDCDMYSNDSKSIRDALCFFMDEKQGKEIAFVQFAQDYENITKNDVYGSSLLVIREVEFHGLDGLGGPFYTGSGCFHQRDILCGKKYDSNDEHLRRIMQNRQENNADVSFVGLEQEAKDLANCVYELDTQWGKEMGLKYGCPVEDVITGLSIKCRGWKAAYFNPERSAFLGVAPTSLNETLVQQKRWSEGDLQIFLSKHCPLWYGHGKISLLHQLGYLHYLFWACNCLPTIFFSTVPSLFLINGIPLFPKISSPWFLAFAYIIIASNTCSLLEFRMAGGTTLGWWNEQRIWLYKRTSSYLFAFVDTILKLVGMSDMKFIITSKVADVGVAERFVREKVEFGVSSPMFTILATIALVNLFALSVAVKRLVMGEMMVGDLGLQVLLCGVLVAINLPLYEALFVRKDKGKMPSSITIKSLSLAITTCTCFPLLFKMH